MPQPASKVKWNGGNAFGSNALTKHPELGSLVAAVIGGWAIIEAHLGRAFVTLIGAKQPVTMSMYAAVWSFDIQREFLRVASADVLPKRYADIFAAALTVLGRSAQNRHKFAHGIWGVSTDPDLEALLLIDTKYFWSLALAQIRAWNTRCGKNTLERLGPYEFQRRQPQLNHEKYSFTV